jgi:Uma2 family endonuclease
MMSTTRTLTTADELFVMPADDVRYELVRGELRRMPPAGSEHGAVAVNIAVMIAQFVKRAEHARPWPCGDGMQDQRTVRSAVCPMLRFVS